MLRKRSKGNHPMVALRRFRSESNGRQINPSDPLRNKTDLLPAEVPSIRLRYGQTIWLLTELGFRGPVAKSTFHEYLKSLRKLGIPFGREKFQNNRRRRLAYYSYCHLMELSVTLSLRVYHVVPDLIVKGIVHHRDRLRRLFRRAYRQRRSGLGKPLVIEFKGHKPVVLRGLCLDLNFKFSGGRMVRFGPPQLLSPVEALAQLSQNMVSARSLAPINLSLLSEQVTTLALSAPAVRSGPPAQPDRRFSRYFHQSRAFRTRIDKQRIILSGVSAKHHHDRSNSTMPINKN
jgi:hypothetical protein